MSKFIPMPQVQNVGPNQRATLRIPLGQTYNKLVLCFAGNLNRALVSNIVLKINGNEKARWNDWGHLQAFNSYGGGASDVNFLELNFIERNAKTIESMTMGAIAANSEAKVQDATLEFDIANYTATPASTVKIFAETDLPSTISTIQRVRFQQRSVVGAEELSISIPFGPQGEQVKRIGVFCTTSAIDSIRIRREGSDELEMTPAQLEYLQRTYGKAPQAGLVMIDFLVHNLTSGALNAAGIMGANNQLQYIQNLDFRIKTNAATAMHIYTESYADNQRP